MTKSVLIALALLVIVNMSVNASIHEIGLLQTYQPPDEVSLYMFRLTENGTSTGLYCGIATQYNWGCTTYCTDPNISSCVVTMQQPYPFATNHPTVEIDGSSGAPDVAPYNQYLRDIVPLEIDIKAGSQGYKPASAVEAQAIAARTYTYQRILYESQYSPRNNSNQFQVFVPYYFDTLTPLQKIIVQIATNNRHYLSEAGNANPIEALFGADNPGVTNQGNRTYLKSVADPISESYGVTDGTLLGGMSSKGASRWSFGHTSSKGAVGATHPNYPHDVDGNGDF